LKETKETTPAALDTGSRAGKPSERVKGLPGPQGIGMAVAFDWGLVVQILLTPFLPLILGESGPLKMLNGGPLASPGVQFLLALPFAALVGIFGEGVRRGWRWTRLVQIVVNTLLFLAGLVGLISTWQGARAGHYWGVYTEFLLLVISPLIVWRMSRPATRTWFREITSAEARLRHGGMWVVWIALWAIAGGVLQTLAAYH
jgi:hypothetical protein